MPKVIYVIYLASILLISNIGGLKLDSTIIASIIGAAVLLIIDILSNIRASKRNEMLINQKFEQMNSILNNIKDDIGRDKNSSLTVQHNDITRSLDSNFKNVNNNFSFIYNRYEKEDESYRSFTSQQRDLKETIDNFSKDYAKVIGYNKKLYNENCKLKEKCDTLIEENQELKSQFGITSPNNSDSRK